MSSQKRDVAKLVVDVSAAGDLSAASLKAIQEVPEAIHGIDRALGMFQLGEMDHPLLLSILVDDSGSIGFAGNTQAIEQGHNRVVQAVFESGVFQNVLLHTVFLNGKVVNAFEPLRVAEPLSSENYRQSDFGGTPLYQQSVVLLASVAAKTRELAEQGKIARSITLIITDGDDQHSGRTPVEHVRWIVNDMRKTAKHIVVGMGVEDGSTNFREVFRNMGIPNGWHLTPNADPKKIIKAFQDFGQAAAKASLDPASFERLALGSGFSS